MLKELRRIFFVGVITLAPLALTIYILVQLFRWFDSLFQPTFLTNYGYMPGLGFLLGIFIILLVGIFAPSLIGKQFFLITDRIAERLPLVKMIYSGTKQVFDSFSHTGSNRFSRVVMVQFPNEKSYSIGFVTQEIAEGWVPSKPEAKLAVFVPTTPNPTSGYLLFVSVNETMDINISVEDALKLVISGGLVRPSNFLHSTKV
ncbi:MAG: DUF502 domain-containing protein [Deltaproteobacteria bacterium]|nr:DUF502 domain-containing protein [Deltaproteobacteria bacterium]